MFDPGFLCKPNQLGICSIILYYRNSTGFILACKWSGSLLCILFFVDRITKRKLDIIFFHYRRFSWWHMIPYRSQGLCDIAFSGLGWLCWRLIIITSSSPHSEGQGDGHLSLTKSLFPRAGESSAVTLCIRPSSFSQPSLQHSDTRDWIQQANAFAYGLHILHM